MLENVIFLIAICIILGNLIGKISIKHIKLGSSATLFIALFISYILGKKLGIQIKVDSTLFRVSLIGFIVSVGLIASNDIKEIIKKYGFKFLILAFVITFSGALITYIIKILLLNSNYELIGSYVGALTSSPGLASALELARKEVLDKSQLIGLGYSISYIPGILVVILFSQYMGKKFNDSKNYKANIIKKEDTDKFDLISFFIVIILGLLLGSIKLFGFSLGVTGGVLISSLLLGSKGEVLNLNFKFSKNNLNIIKEISLNSFLAIVGLNYGFKAINSISSAGFLFIVGLIIAIFSVIIGYLVGKFILKIETIYLVGAICGGMTSTPGLASSIDAFKSDDVVVGYGATYPFALIFMIIFTNLLFRI